MVCEKHLLITGFDPFDGESINPSWEVVSRLPESLGGFTLHKLQIPTVFSLAAEKVVEAAKEIQPDVILCIGQAGGRGAVTPERVAINIRDARICDNAGNQPVDQPIVPDGPDAYFATVPVKAMVQAMIDAGCDAAISNTAGTFVCNDVLYTLLHHYHGTSVQAGFIHVPYFPEQGSLSLSPEATLTALKAAICAIL